MTPAKSKARPHLFVHDAGVPADQKGRRFCTCSRPEDHPCHALPEPVADVRQLAAHEED